MFYCCAENCYMLNVMTMILRKKYIHFLLVLFTCFFGIGIQGYQSQTRANALAKPDKVSVFEGQHIYVYMSIEQNLTRCWTMFPNRTEVDLEPQDTDTYSVKYWGSGLSAGMCGIEAWNLNVSGVWSLRANDSYGVTYQARFSVNLYNYPDLQEEEEHLLLQPDESLGEIKINLLPDNIKNETSVYCIIYAPSHSFATDLKYDGCSVYISHLTKAYEGQWTSKLGIEGLAEEIVYAVNVTVSEPHIVSGWDFSTSDDGAIDIFCNLVDYAFSSGESLKYCRFTRPGDKKGIHINNGVSNGHYFGYGMEKNECHLTISKPDSLDYGIWSCSLKINDAVYASKILIPGSHKAEDEDPVLSMKKEVVNGKSTYILCSSNFYLSGCFILSPLGEVFSGDHTRLGFGECFLNISSAQSYHNGTWECHMTSEMGTSVSFVELFVSDSEFIATTPTVNAKNGGTASLLCRTVLTPQMTAPSLASCRFVRSDGTSITPPEDGSVVNDLYQYYGRGLHNGECGLKINTAGHQDQGRWFCIAQIYGRFTENYARIFLNIEESARAVPTEEFLFSSTELLSDTSDTAWTKLLSDTVYVKIGETVQLNCDEPGALYCTFIAPNSSQVLVDPGPCSKTVEHITTTDIGLWTCYIGLMNSITESKKNIELILQDDVELVGWKKSDIKESAVDIYCNIGKPLKFCHFVKPNGESLRVIDGLGTEGKIYYGKGLSAGDCGITTTLVDGDYGTWKCALGVTVNGNSETETRIISIQNNTTGKIKLTVSQTVKHTVTAGTELLISCEAESALKYCWIKHPNGTQINANVDVLAGMCVTVTMAAESDTGPWECHFGFADREQISYIDVTVTGSTLYAVKEISVLGNSVSFLCKSVPAGRSLKYCRFIRPDGKGFSLTTGSVYDNYRYNGAGLQYGECGIVIQNIRSEDYGQWLCAGRVHGETVEGSDLISITYEDSSWPVGAIIGSAVGGSLFVFTVVFLGVYYFKKWKETSVQQPCSIDTISNTSSQEPISGE